MSEVKRYYLECSHDGDNDFILTEAEDGGWVRYEDIANLQRDRDTIGNVNLELHDQRAELLTQCAALQRELAERDRRIVETEDKWGEERCLLNKALLRIERLEQALGHTKQIIVNHMANNKMTHKDAHDDDCAVCILQAALAPEEGRT